MLNPALSTATPSAQHIYDLLRTRKVMQLKDIIKETGLSKRTVLYAIRDLREAGLIEIQICMTDTRRKFYCYRIQQGKEQK